jgi:hypothetical protein
MANLNETAVWVTNVASLLTSDDVKGGTGGAPNDGESNQPHIHLANRTQYLKNRADGQQISIDANTNQISTNIADITTLTNDKYDKSGGPITGPVTIDDQTIGIGGTSVMTFSGAAQMLLTGSGHINQAGTGDIKVTGSGRFAGKGDQVQQVPKINAIPFVLMNSCKDYSGTPATFFGTAAAPNPEIISPHGSAKMIVAAKWNYNEDGQLNLLALPPFICPPDYASGGLIRFGCYHNLVGASPQIGFFVNNQPSLGLTPAGSDPVMNSASITGGGTPTVYSSTISSNDFEPGVAYNVNVYVVNAAFTSGAIRIYGPRFEYTPY